MLENRSKLWSKEVSLNRILDFERASLIIFLKNFQRIWVLANFIYIFGDFPLKCPLYSLIHYNQSFNWFFNYFARVFFSPVNRTRFCFHFIKDFNFILLDKQVTNKLGSFSGWFYLSASRILFVGGKLSNFYL